MGGDGSGGIGGGDWGEEFAAAGEKDGKGGGEGKEEEEESRTGNMREKERDEEEDDDDDDGAPPPDYEDVFGDEFRLRDDENDGDGYGYGYYDGEEEIIGGGVKGCAGVKMGFFDRMRAKREAKRRVWLERRGESQRGGGCAGGVGSRAGFGFGCRGRGWGGRRGRCM